MRRNPGPVAVKVVRERESLRTIKADWRNGECCAEALRMCRYRNNYLYYRVLRGFRLTFLGKVPTNCKVSQLRTAKGNRVLWHLLGSLGFWNGE